MSLYYALESVNKSNFPSLQNDLTDQNYDLFYCSLIFAFKSPPFLSITILASVQLLSKGAYGGLVLDVQN